eukprot:CAMPEP_0198208450 /NCGR_PEP_ID=MMETSP1445-20131203/11812_1 /TAXON_ID=36898 /ORGANISM="Pyramimonas sp., Strain CCMP2087" /LENGTH=75 /DNA_ID=CAMNT_0043881853 /DNA_START=729 /DNA_END=953 /DNA_ORIENTATION=+
MGSEGMVDDVAHAVVAVPGSDGGVFVQLVHAVGGEGLELVLVAEIYVEHETDADGEHAAENGADEGLHCHLLACV